MANDGYVLDRQAVLNLRRVVEQQNLRIQSLERRLANVSVRRHESDWKPSSGAGIEAAAYSNTSTQTVTTSTKYIELTGEAYAVPGTGSRTLRADIDVANGGTYNGELVFSRQGAYRFDIHARMQPSGTLTGETRCFLRFWYQASGSGSYAELNGTSMYFAWPSGASSSAIFEASTSNHAYITTNTRITLQAARNGSASDDILISGTYVLVTFIGEMTQTEYNAQIS